MLRSPSRRSLAPLPVRGCLQKPKRSALVNCDVIRLITLDEILGFLFRGTVDVALEPHVGDNLSQDDAPDSTCLRIPSDMGTAFECLRHRSSNDCA